MRYELQDYNRNYEPVGYIDTLLTDATEEDVQNAISDMKNEIENYDSFDLEECIEEHGWELVWHEFDYDGLVIW